MFLFYLFFNIYKCENNRVSLFSLKLNNSSYCGELFNFNKLIPFILLKLKKDYKISCK